MATSIPITVAHGNGIGPEIMAATLHILKEAGAPLDIETIEIGEKVYLAGNTSGIEPSAWDSLKRTKVFLKAPITTPQGGGMKSLNVTIRKTLGLYANVRPCVSYHPYVATKHPTMDLVIVRENEEDLYAGIEHRQTDDSVQCLKLLTRPGCERIVRYAFEYAITNNRKHVTCMTKDNIMKFTDGLFHKVFREIGEEYPSIEKDHYILDIGAARVADTPEIFEVLVTLNLYGDVISDIAAQVAGSVGLAGSSNIGESCAMFEAIHGSAPSIAGQNIANPSGLLLSAVMMLVHIDQPDIAGLIHNAWLRTIEDGIHTPDIYSTNTSTEKVGTQEFANAVIARLGKSPEKLTPVHYVAHQRDINAFKIREFPRAKKEMVGVDVFLHYTGGTPSQLGRAIDSVSGDGLDLHIITNRGVKVWPEGMSETYTSDHWRCRFMAAEGNRTVKHQQIISLLARMKAAGFDWIKMETLCTFDGEIGYSAS